MCRLTLQAASLFSIQAFSCPWSRDSERAAGQGYLVLDGLHLGGDDAETEDKLELLSLIDILVDGRFDLTKKNLMLQFRGSSNQRIIDVQKSLEAGKVIIWDKLTMACRPMSKLTEIRCFKKRAKHRYKRGFTFFLLPKQYKISVFREKGEGITEN